MVVARKRVVARQETTRARGRGRSLGEWGDESVRAPPRATHKTNTTKQTYGNGKDGSVITVTTLNHGIGRLEKLGNDANQGNRHDGGARHEGRRILAALETGREKDERQAREKGEQAVEQPFHHLALLAVVGGESFVRKTGNYTRFEAGIRTNLPPWLVDDGCLACCQEPILLVLAESRGSLRIRSVTCINTLTLLVSEGAKLPRQSPDLVIL
jgi:hypothetical protein